MISEKKNKEQYKKISLSGRNESICHMLYIPFYLVRESRGDSCSARIRMYLLGYKIYNLLPRSNKIVDIIYDMENFNG